MRQLFRNSIVRLALLAALPAAAAAQEAATITGRVTGEGGAPLAAVTVVIPELGVGTQTRDDGRYTLAVPGARVTRQSVALSARRVGYKPRTVRLTLVPGNSTQDFTLETNPLQLGEVVITGAGTATEVEKLGSVRNAVSADLIVRANESNVVQALAAKAPGVDVTSSAGDPGASSTIKIRGLRTINGSAEPLFVIDGIPVDNSSNSTTNLNPIDAGGTGQAGQVNGGEIEGTSQPNRLSDINPDDIESVEILKGAAAGAIYGSRAANGVILITTKRGRAGETRYALRSSLSNDEITRRYPLQSSYSQGQNNLRPATCLTNSVSGAAASGSCFRSWGPTLGAGDQTFDHASEAFRTGHVTDNVVSMSGGNDRTTFYLSGNLNRNRGIFVGPNNFYDRSTVRLNATHKLAETFNVGGNFSFADTRGHFTQRGNNVNGLLLGLLRTPPNFNNFPYLDPTTGLHRSYLLPAPSLASAGESRGFNNPLYSLNEELNQAQANRTFGNIHADWVANSWLKFNYTLGGDYSNDERLEVCPQECSDVAAGGRITEGKLINYSIDHNLTATGRYQLNENFGGNVTLGQNLNSRNYRTFSTVGRGMIVPGLFSISNTLSRDPSADYQTQIHDESYFGQATFDLFRQLYVTAALRNDGSSTFGSSTKRNWFPKASVAWNPLQVYQPSMLSFLSSVKLRYSYGQAGQEPEPYLTSITYNLSGVTPGITQGTGLSPTQSGQGGVFYTTTRPATTLKPERTEEHEGGFDIGFWGDRADLSATFYRQRTTDAILTTPTTASSGYSFEAKNAAIIRNSGTEISLNLRPFTTATQAWDIGFGWARNQSIVDSIAGAEFLYIDNATVGIVAKEGYPLGVIYGYGMVRCGLSDPEEVPGLAAACAGKPTGTLYIDDGSNCSWDPGMPCGEGLAQRVLGNPNPRWTGNIRSSYRYRKVSVSGLLDIRKGGDIHNGTKGALWSYGTHAETAVRAICTNTHAVNCTGNLQTFGSANWYPGEVTGPGAGTAVPIGQNWYRNGIAPCPFTGIDEQCVEDGSYVKLREISLGYQFDNAWVTRGLGLSTVDVRVAGRNLKTWTKYTGLDPETNLGGSISRVGGADYFNLPQSRSIVFTVGLNR
jgi:TonB-linked SusC/RagA family outer membrane protein